MALLIVQARMGSTRLPGKSLADLRGQPVIWHLFNQMRASRTARAVILATTDLPQDDPLARFGEAQGWAVFRGHPTDLLARYHDAAVAFGADETTPVVRLTGDDIFSDPLLVDGLVDLYRSLAGRVDVLLTDRRDHRLPYGGGASLFSFRALAQAHREATDPFDREHVGPYLFRNSHLFPQLEVVASHEMPGLSLSVDTAADLERAGRILDALAGFARPPYRLADVLRACDVLIANGEQS